MSNMNRIATVMVAVFVSMAPQTALAAPGAEQKAVLVTGASSGIGLRTTEVLSTNGFYVYAGARSRDDLERLDAMDNVSSVKLDVTLQEDVDKAFDFVEAQGRGLWGVVNNAGVVEYSSLVDGPLSGVEFTFDVNVYGPIRVNIAFLPLLEESRGRTVTISSIAGFLAGRSGSYTMSKFAVEGYTDSLARELAGSGVHVSAVEPGGYRSKMQENRVERLLERAERGEIDLSEERRAELLASLTDVDSMKEPYEVAAAILDIMSSSTPKPRYLVTPDEQQADMTIRGTMKRMLQLNEDHRYSLDRDELVEMLDELLAE
jgi:NAD(P)-dependent dehydrogenase (short-subunit alcohol dehydrogenase family)